jgi:hypothetical protein
MALRQIETAYFEQNYKLLATPVKQVIEKLASIMSKPDYDCRAEAVMIRFTYMHYHAYEYFLKTAILVAKHDNENLELMCLIYDMLEHHAKIAINLLVMMNPYALELDPEVQNAVRIGSLECYTQDRDHFLDKLYYEPCSLEIIPDHKHKCLLVFHNLGDIAKHKAALVVRVDFGKYRTGIGTEFQRDEDLYDHLAEEVAMSYMETRPEFEARYESKKSHAEMVGRMKQVSKAWNEVCKVSTKWNLMVPSCLLNM